MREIQKILTHFCTINSEKINFSAYMREFFSPPARNNVPHALNVIHRMKGKFFWLCESDAKHKLRGKMLRMERDWKFVLVMRKVYVPHELCSTLLSV
jgi:hypothetical protein